MTTTEELKERTLKLNKTIFAQRYDYLIEEEILFIWGDQILLLWSGRDFSHDIGPMFREEVITRVEEARRSGAQNFMNGIIQVEILDPDRCLTHKSASVRRAAKYCLGLSKD